MSRTRKDEPEFVKKIKHGTITHDANCSRRDEYYDNPVTVSFNAYFYAHEVDKMRALEEALSDKGATFSVSEKRGYLFTFKGNAEDSWTRDYLKMRKAHKLMKDVVDFNRHGVETDSVGVTQYSHSKDIYFMFSAPFDRSKLNLFKVYSIELELESRRYTNNRPDVFGVKCCEPALPAKMRSSKRGCPCCLYSSEDFDSETDVRTSLLNTAKAFNSEDFYPDDDSEDSYNTHAKCSRF